MQLFNVGDICVKIAGRETGRKCVIVERIDKNYVVVTGPKHISGVRRRKANVDHLEPTGKRISINEGASDEEVEKALADAGLIDWMREVVKPEL